MATADIKMELLNCSVCLTVYTDPVILRCGHNFCRVCIESVLDTQEGSGRYSCPECRANSEERPTLIKNITLCSIMDSLQSAQSTEAVQPDFDERVFCTYCVDSPVPAVKSCLHCEASMCDKHLKVHSKSPDHVLTEPTTSLEKNKLCPVHKKIVEYYCAIDNSCICELCRLEGDHEGHRVKILNEAFKLKKKKLISDLKELNSRTLKAEQRIQVLHECKREAQSKADGVSERVSNLFRELWCQLEDIKNRLLGEISNQAKQRSVYISNMIQHLETKVAEISVKVHHIQELCKMTEPKTFLQETEMANVHDPDGEHDRTKWLHSGGVLEASVVSHTIAVLAGMIKMVNAGIYAPEHARILWDLNSTSDFFRISSDGRAVFWSHGKMVCPETINRFQNHVMSSRNFSSGWHYWEIECNDMAMWGAGMCYPTLESRNGAAYLGTTCNTWCLNRINNTYRAKHEQQQLHLNHPVSSNRIRITLDYEAGHLSFYELCSPNKHIYTFKAAFTEPLHAVIYLYGLKDSWVRVLECPNSSYERPYSRVY